MLQASKTNMSVGRFAPSPTGPLHFGSLLAALGSYLLARQQGGQWLLRIEDLDPPRVVPGSAEEILRLLEGIGFQWDGEVIWQSRRGERYLQVLEQLCSHDLVFECSCSRREILLSAPHPGEEGPVYPGSCRQGPVGQRPERAVRLQVDEQPIRYRDMLLGEQEQNLQQAVGDFVLRRADGLFAYQLAVVVDDIDAGVTQVVRGADLLSSTPRQIYLYRCLQQPAPEYCHLPLAVGADGEKLSKRHGSAAIITGENAGRALWSAYKFLGQPIPTQLSSAPTAELLAWGLENFSLARVPLRPGLAEPFGE